jgi:hypothetical protein
MMRAQAAFDVVLLVVCSFMATAVAAQVVKPPVAAIKTRKLLSDGA